MTGLMHIEMSLKETGMREWNDGQKAVLDSLKKDLSILVSAAAGSGKTAVLVERIVQSVEQGLCGIDEILVVTFTKAAAAQMKGKITRLLEERAYESGDPRLLRQLALAANADIYIIATVMKRNGRPKTLMSPSFVDFPYTNQVTYNQVHVLTFTLDDSAPVVGDPGIVGSFNSATEGIVRKLAGLALPDIVGESMYSNYRTWKDDNIVSIPGILALPWCWYDDVPHDLSVLRTIVQNGHHSSGCIGITHGGPVPYLTYSKGSVYEEVEEQFPELFKDNVTYGDTEYVQINL